MRDRVKVVAGSLLVAVAVCFFLRCAGVRQQGPVTYISIEEEIALGKEVSVQAGQILKLVRNQEVSRYFQEMTNRMGAASDWSGLAYTLHVVNEPDLNHFSLPGGQIFLFRGLLESAAAPDQVAAVIAHEMAHLSARDGVDRLALKYGSAMAAQTVVGQNPEIARQIIANLYSEDTILDYPKSAEQEADRKCVKYVWKALYDPRGAVDMMYILRRAGKSHPLLVSLLCKTHPSLSSRYKTVNKEVKMFSAEPETGSDTGEFLRIKEILSRIPY